MRLIKQFQRDGQYYALYFHEDSIERAFADYSLYWFGIEGVLTKNFSISKELDMEPMELTEKLILEIEGKILLTQWLLDSHQRKL